MGINSGKILSVLLTALTFAHFLPRVVVAESSTPNSNSSNTAAPANPTPIEVNELSPQQRGAIQQALLRQRNTEIIEILDEKQKNKFYEALRKRRRFSTALEELKLTPEQESRVNAVISEYNSKMKAVGTGQPSQSTQQRTPTTTAP